MAKQQAHVFTTPLKPSELHLAMELADMSGTSLMIWGAPGIGKSQLVAKYADDHYPLASRNTKLVEQMRAEVEDSEIPTTQKQLDSFTSKLLNQEFNLVDFRLSQVDAVDLRGCPVPVTCYINVETDEFVPDHLVTPGMNVVKKTQTIWAPPGVLDLPANWKGVIFMDEVNGAMPIVQAACYQLFLDRKIGEMCLPKGALIVAAGNRECDGGVTFQLATPLKDRMTHVELKADLKEWTENYAMQARVDADVISYLQARGADFNTLSPQNPNICGGTSPRSWVTASTYKKQFRQRYGNGSSEQNRVMYAMLDGTLGDDVSQRFKLHCEMTCKLPPAIQVLTGEFTDVSKLPDMDVSRNYAICSNLVYAMIEANDEVKAKTLTAEKYNEYANNFLKFIDFNYGEKQKELAIMSFKTMFNHKIYFHPVHVPYYKEFAKRHHALIVKARVA